MPVNYTYPGVYVEEIPSGVRTIAGVSTSDTAFVDFFPRGPVNRATRITGFGDFGRIFGGLDPRSEASYAIQQYYLNGGQVAWVVRVDPLGTDGQPLAQTAELVLDGGYPAGPALRVMARNPGEWGNALQVAVETVPGSTTLYNLQVREILMANGQPVLATNGQPVVVATETHLNLSGDMTGSRYAPDVIEADSQLISVSDEGEGQIPMAMDFASLEGGSDGDFIDATGEVQEEAAFAASIIGDETLKTGMRALDRIAPAIFNILCLPAAARLATDSMNAIYNAAKQYCEDRRAFLLVDIPASINTVDEMVQWMNDNSGLRHRNAAVYFPRVTMPDARNQNRPRDVAVSGTLAGVYARIDASRGVWKAPAGTEATLNNVNLAAVLTDRENGALNPMGVNVLRSFPVFGKVSWGARTLDGADQQASEWKYIPVRRMALYIEESLYQGLQWVVFEPNDEPLWSQIRLNVGAFMQNLFRQGAFQGKTPREAYFVKCDKETTTQYDIDRGVVNIIVGFAPLKPAEFVVLKIQQMARQAEA